MRIVDDDRVPSDTTERRSRLQTQGRARRQRRVRGIEHDQTSSHDAMLIPAHRPHGDGQLVHGSPQYDEKEEIDQRDERDAECHVEPTVGNELFEHRLDHSAATVYRTVPNATSSPAAMVAALRRWPLTQVPLVLLRSIARQP